MTYLKALKGTFVIKREVQKLDYAAYLKRKKKRQVQGLRLQAEPMNITAISASLTTANS